MRRGVAAILVVVSFWLAATPAWAQVEVSFPLAPHYRIGKYFPARLTGTLPGDPPLRVEAINATPTSVAWNNGRVDAVVPMLAIRRIEDPTLSVGGDPKPLDGSLEPLEDDERLVGMTNLDEALAAELFPDQRRITVRLDPTDPLPGPALAWGALDGVLLDAPAAARVSEAQLASLLACGATVAVKADRRPASDWPWEQRGAWWVVRPDANAAVDVVQPGRYEPLLSRVAGAPPEFRRSIVLGLSAFALVGLGASLWRARHAWIAVVLVSGVAAGLLALWHARQSTATTIVSEERSGPWLDRYVSHAAFADGRVRQPVAEPDVAAWPVFFSMNHGATANVRLECAADGTPEAFVAGLTRGQGVVFLTRSRAEPGPRPAPAPATSPAAPPR